MNNTAASIIHRHSRSFSLATGLLPRRVRLAVMQLYAWCRTVDDMVDHADEQSQVIIRLERIQADVVAMGQGAAPRETASGWLQPLISRGLVDPEPAIELLAGMRLDCDEFQPRDMADLHRYCYHVAGTVGLMMAQLMGTRSPAARVPAISLGTAMQLTNIVRDIREDAQRGRSYLPGIERPLECDPRLVRRQAQQLLTLAEEQYAIAAKGVHLLPRDCRMAVRVALAVYREIGREIARQGYPVLQERVILSRTRVLWVALRATLSLSLLPSPFPAGDFTMPTTNVGKTSRLAQARWAVCLGLSLTATMSAVLFLLVFINPKEDSYGYLPLLYSGLSVLAAVVMYFLTLRFESQVTRPEATVKRVD